MHQTSLFQLLGDKGIDFGDEDIHAYPLLPWCFLRDGEIV